MIDLCLSLIQLTQLIGFSFTCSYKRCLYRSYQCMFRSICIECSSNYHMLDTLIHTLWHKDPSTKLWDCSTFLSDLVQFLCGNRLITCRQVASYVIDWLVIRPWAIFSQWTNHKATQLIFFSVWKFNVWLCRLSPLNDSNNEILDKQFEANDVARITLWQATSHLFFQTHILSQSKQQIWLIDWSVDLIDWLTQE